MISKISEGITISVETYYQPEYSNPVTANLCLLTASPLKITIHLSCKTFTQTLAYLRQQWQVYVKLKVKVLLVYSRRLIQANHTNI